jgi:hypothetical protein
MGRCFFFLPEVLLLWLLLFIAGDAKADNKKQVSLLCSQA